MSASNFQAVFLSYAHEDFAAAQRIAERLRSAGIEVWLDQNELRGGAQTEAIPEIRRLIEQGAFAEAHALATRVEATAPSTAGLPELWRKMTQTTSITSEPAGAEVKVREFVEAGGYRRREYWKFPIIKDGAEMEWEKAMALLLDATGRPGPATWELGTYPRGQEEFPVTGVSWYEAAAYAEFAGRSLPTVYHWVRAASTNMPAAVIALSNFNGKGPAAVGSHQGMSAPEHKRHVVYETGHGPFPQNALIREVLDWLDKYLGPAK